MMRRLLIGSVLVFTKRVRPDESLQSILDGVVERWLELERNKQEEFRSTLQRYIRLYGYISQLITFTDVALEKTVRLWS